ncbi:sensor histidine kinase [Actinopolymorpha sp. B17G11]|uniref:sensor histidine kinase n=1 Tax=unclassified Actinopolymorpha TaxID=2627063 RepID=UPI0032D9A401
MKVIEPASALEIWERREMPIYRGLPYVLLGLSLIVTLFHEQSQGRTNAILAVTALAVAWVYCFVTRRPTTFDRQPLSTVYFVGLLILAGILVALAPWYGIFAWVGYLHSMIILPGRWRFVGIAGTAAVSALSQTGGMQEPSPAMIASYVALFAVNTVIAGTMCFFAVIAGRQHENRKATLAELAEANAKLTAMMEENAGLHTQLLTQAREAGVLDERQRMAREIHDTLAQGLTGIITQLQAADQAKDNPAEWQRHLDTAAVLARESLSEARRSVHAVRPEALEVARLPEALEDVVERWSAVNDVPASVTTTGTARPLHPEVEVTLLRTAQEGLANVAKHANATRVGLTLSYMEDVVTLDVRDDGAGFEIGNVPEAAGQQGGFGLTAMRQRVRRLAGRLEVESESGVGTAISASVPAIAAGAAE